MTTENELTEEQIKEALRNSEVGKHFYDIWYAGTISQQEKWMKMFEAGMKAGFELGQKAQWISTADDLPKPDQIVLIHYETFMTNSVISVAIMFNGIQFRQLIGGDRVDTVTHWMPLLESPGE